MKSLLQIILLLFSNIAIAQIKFPLTPTVRTEGDTSFYELNNGRFYSYFYQQFDSIFISFDPIKFYQIAAISNKTQNGYFLIKHENKVLIYNEIRGNKIEGLGYMYHPDLLGRIYALPYCQAMFSNNRLDGITSFYGDETGIIKAIILYQDGKYKKYLYHHLAKSSKELERGNKLAKDPFKYFQDVR